MSVRDEKTRFDDLQDIYYFIFILDTKEKKNNSEVKK